MENSEEKSEIIKTFNGLTCPLVIAMVGLPARGKTSMAKNVTRFLNWNGYLTKFFSTSSYVSNNLRELGRKTSADFYEHTNTLAQKIRLKALACLLEDVVNWFEDGGIVAVIDGSLYSLERRKFMSDYIVAQHSYQLMFIESICDNPEIIKTNILAVKITNSDDHERAVEEYLERISNYEKHYVPLSSENSEEDYSFIKIFNQGDKYIVANIEGFLPSKVVAYLMNIRFQSRTIYITRHGESLYNLSGRIGGDSELSDLGFEFAKKLGDYVVEEGIKEVWTSNLVRSFQTSKFVQDTPVKKWKALNELNAGLCDGITYDQFQEKFPDLYKSRQFDKFNFRYPGCGESYNDLVHRLEGVIVELERHTNVMVISHQAVVRCLLAYYMETSHDDIPYINVPLHTVLKLTSRPYDCKVEFIKLDTSPPVDTYHQKQ